MAKNKSISNAIAEIQKENERLKSLKKFFDKAVKAEFGYDIKTLHKIIEKHTENDHRTSTISISNQPINATRFDT